ncbi:MAG: hypothetical protein Q9227_008959 [Pyrenula ochraceoflavens]
MSNPSRNPNDATIDIPLTTVPSRGQTGARKADAGLAPNSYMQPATPLSADATNEKAGLFHRHNAAGRRKKLEDNGRSNSSEEDGTLTTMGKFYSAVLNFSIVTRYFLYVLPLAVMIAIPIIIGATAAPHAKIGDKKTGVRIVWFFTWVEIVWLSLWVSKLFAKLLPIVFQFLVGIVSSGVRKYALVLIALEIPLSLVGWALTSLATFVPVMTLNPDNRKLPHNLQSWETTVQNLLFAALFSTIILLIEKFLVQLISISYHRKQFDAKIKDSKRNIWLLGLLYDASIHLFPAYCSEFASEDYTINDGLDLSSKGASSHARSGSATPMRLIQNVGRVGDKITAAVGNVASEITGKQVFNATSAHSVVIEALEKNRPSEALARRLWMSFVMEGKDALYQEDIADVLGPDRKAEAEECFACLDRDGNGDISLDEMILTVCEFGRERKSIANSMHDVDQAINVLDNLLCVVVFIIVVFIFVAFLNRSFTTTLATAGTALLSLSFVFAATAQEVLGSCIFLFVKHPFDVGDRVDVSTSTDGLIVERISLLYTVFRKTKDGRLTQVPNIVLNGIWIDNISRSKAMREAVTLYVNFDTTLEDIQLLKNEMQNFVREKDNARDFQPDVDIEVISLNEMDQLQLKIEIRHKSNWANGAVCAARRSKFMCALVLALRKVPIYGPGAGGAALGEPGNPSYSVSVTDSEAAEARQDFADKKDAKRLVPLNSKTNSGNNAQADGASSSVDYPPQYSLPRSETQAVEMLNSRAPAIDPNRDDSRDYYQQASPPTTVSSPEEGKRSQDLQDVRDILRRQSTRGRRKAAGRMSPIPGAAAAPQSNIPIIQEPVMPPAPLRAASRTGTPVSGNQPVEYYDYEYTPQIQQYSSGAARAQSPTSPTQYQSNNPYGRAPPVPYAPSGGVTSPTTRRPVPPRIVEEGRKAS